ncbi:MAG: coniferyl aldehyde dehydrogenase [Pseudomonadota bacterium]
MNMQTTEAAVEPHLILNAMRSAHKAEPYPNYQTRKDRLQRLEKAMHDYADRLVAAMQEDFSHRSAAECNSFDVTLPIGEIRFARRRLRKWMRGKFVMAPKHLLPARGRIAPQPLGVVGIIAPWNFPVLLAIAPAAAALAAGNRMMIKPSEITPKTSAVMTEMLEGAFAPEEIAVVNGGPIISAEFSKLPFDHLLFTGSTKVGREVAKAAAENLTPVTLELGGKSPAIVTPSADMNLAAKRIAFGKTTNAGQICMSPDYAFVPRAELESFTDKLIEAMKGYYPDFGGSDDYTAIVSEGHVARLKAMVDEAEAAGAKVIRLEQGGDPAGARKLAPIVIVDPDPSLKVMQEEIFGPILPVLPYDDQKDALSFVAERDHPLSLYIFADKSADKDLWLKQSLAGGVAINETLFHFACDTLPFGGVGASGMGSYHGDQGFETFSHMKSVFIQPKLNASFLFNPPISGFKETFGKIFRKII